MNKRALITVIFFVVVLAVAVVTYIKPDSGAYEDGLVAYASGDYATALRLWRPMAEQGYPGAQNNLGVMYRDGLGVPEDDMQAYIWFSLAVSSYPPGEDHDRSAKGRDALAKFMGPDQIAWVEKKAREWKPREKGAE